ncbi:MAG: hypothetical protein BWY92_01771 [Firmicutes bacterium ADurb.BinA052]|nr:MAG: hypothetical protein BWY92_01771 [Firmicutes bacterium ADurb.BinA052]
MFVVHKPLVGLEYSAFQPGRHQRLRIRTLLSSAPHMRQHPAFRRRLVEGRHRVAQIAKILYELRIRFVQPRLELHEEYRSRRLRRSLVDDVILHKLRHALRQHHILLGPRTRRLLPERLKFLQYPLLQPGIQLQFRHQMMSDLVHRRREVVVVLRLDQLFPLAVHPGAILRITESPRNKPLYQIADFPQPERARLRIHRRARRFPRPRLPRKLLLSLGGGEVEQFLLLNNPCLNCFDSFVHVGFNFGGFDCLYALFDVGALG